MNATYIQDNHRYFATHDRLWTFILAWDEILNALHLTWGVTDEGAFM